MAAACWLLRLGKFGPRLARFAGMTYRQIKETLRVETAQWEASAGM